MKTNMFKALTLSLFVIFCQSAAALEPQHFDSVETMVEEFGDYSADNDTFKLISTSPLEVAFHPMVLSGEPASSQLDSVNRAALYGVYRIFIHTNAKAVEVTASPLLHDLHTDTVKLLDSPVLRLKVTRDDALAVAKDFIPVSDLSELVEPQKLGTMQLDGWVKPFAKLYASEQGAEELVTALKAR
ncbi:hypothetical protein [Pseudomonas sp. RIT-PI-S]|uniref:hypothetical protein n=1 Tax=Pseudomonas sp. RIT-PI-S TaxID=3035295 RepID=UPI0021DA4BA2|nr:hypothetical protein [Pseudomonas sp. RIT-PI-S]